jgi:UDP-N-acetylmuramoyl-tripeptide--D-alanyl-D-alanine ligase
MADVLWTPDELVAATGGTLLGNVTQPLNGVSIDSREIAAGDIFVAIKGDRMDGHDFAATALKVGAGLAIVSRTTPEMRAAGAVLQVTDDPLRSLEAMGRAARMRSPAQIAAVTGSVGKTSTKEMLRTALAASGATHASAKSFNNHWGVPLTLSRLSRQSAYAVFEIGMNHAGEITPLVKMTQPHVAIITTIAASHLGHFSSLDGIAEAKAEIFSGIVKGGAALISRDTPYFSYLADKARASGVQKVFGFGEHPEADVALQGLALHPECCCITANVLGERMVYRLGLPGKHMAINSLAVLGAVKLMGADMARAGLALSEARPAAGRGVREVLAHPHGMIQLLDESYNANPASMQAAIALLAQMKPGKGGRRIAVLGDMLELGDFSPGLHRDIAADLQAHNIDALFASGPMMKNLWDATPPLRHGAYASSAEQLAPMLLEALKPGDCVMVKGSLGSRMGLIVGSLRKSWPPLAASQTKGED